MAIRDPRQYAIYDAWVAIALNAIQACALGRIDFHFEVPSTRTLKANTAKARVRAYLGTHTVHLRGEDLYRRYIEALKKAKGGHSLHAAELYLFHTAPKWGEKL